MLNNKDGIKRSWNILKKLYISREFIYRILKLKLFWNLNLVRFIIIRIIKIRIKLQTILRKTFSHFKKG